MLRHLIFNERIAIHIINPQEWEEFLSICKSYGLKVYNHSAFDEGWTYFGRMESYPSTKCVCGWSDKKAQNDGRDIFTLHQLKEQLCICGDESDLEIDSEIL